VRGRALALGIVTVAEAILVTNCGKSLPEAYGVYADTNGGRLLLAGQITRVAGNLLQPIYGLSGPSGSECTSLKEFIVYLKDVRPDTIGLVELAFEKEATLAGFVGTSRARVNLWLPQKRIELDIKPVEQRRDMYIVVPRVRLSRGFYALYIESFGAMAMGAPVYALVVGTAKDFPSYEEETASRQGHLKSTAEGLINRMNELLNKRDYASLQEVYRPDGRVLSGKEFEDFVAGNKTWLDSSGKILNSRVTDVSAWEDRDGGRCFVVTTYEKAGSQKESVTIGKVGTQYFIMSIQ